MNTKSVVAKPKAAKAAVKAAKAVVKKPKAVPKATKAVVKKPKAAKAAKAVVKKPKAAKVAKAVVKKPIKYNNINGGGGSSRSSTSGVGSYLRKLFPFKRTSNAVAPIPPVIKEDTPVVEEPSRAPIEKCVRPSPSNLLNKILQDYKTLFVDKIIEKDFTLYDLLFLIENIADNLDKFFEEFLHFYPIIIFNVDDEKTYYGDDNKFLKFQDELVKINSRIRYYVGTLIDRPTITYRIFENIVVEKFEPPAKDLKPDGKLDTSKMVYNGILDGTQKGRKEYMKSGLNFFRFKYILNLNKQRKANKIQYLCYKLYFGDELLVTGEGQNNEYKDFNHIVEGLYIILQVFFSYILFMEINDKKEVHTDIIDQCKDYITTAKQSARQNLILFNKLYQRLNEAINEQKTSQYKSEEPLAVWRSSKQKYSSLGITWK
jgi:hypothetical protein